MSAVGCGCEVKPGSNEILFCAKHYDELFEDNVEPEYSDTTPINNVGELIRVLSYWCPDTPVEFADAENGEQRVIVQTNYDSDVLTFLVE